VAVDGDAFARLGMPVLSCHDIGMPPIPRLKKKSKTKSMVLPTSVLLSIPAGPLVLIGGPPTISLAAMAAKAIFAGLGKALGALARSKRLRNFRNRLRRGRRGGRGRAAAGVNH
jgi:hypothetical protein